MKKLIRICAFLSLVMVFSIVSAQAQTMKQYEAKIPFDFNIGQKSYQAGSYVIKITRLSSNGITLSLEDEKRNNLQTVLVSETGNLTKGEPQLLFNRYENKRFLAEIVTAEVGVSIGMSKAEKSHSARNPQPASQMPIIAAKAHKN